MNVYMNSRSGGLDTTHIQQDDGEFSSTRLHCVKHLLCTNTLVRPLLYISINSHHVVHVVELKAMTSKEEQSINILSQERGKILQGL